MNEDSIQVGSFIEHVPTGNRYRVLGIGQMKLPNGAWTGSARYAPVESSAEYHRQLSDFGHFRACDPPPRRDCRHYNCEAIPARPGWLRCCDCPREWEAMKPRASSR